MKYMKKMNMSMTMRLRLLAGTMLLLLGATGAEQ